MSYNFKALKCTKTLFHKIPDMHFSSKIIYSSSKEWLKCKEFYKEGIKMKRSTDLHQTLK